MVPFCFSARVSRLAVPLCIPGRDLDIVRASVGDCPLTVVNTHLESPMKSKNVRTNKGEKLDKTRAKSENKQAPSKVRTNRGHTNCILPLRSTGSVLAIST